MNTSCLLPHPILYFVAKSWAFKKQKGKYSKPKNNKKQIKITFFMVSWWASMNMLPSAKDAILLPWVGTKWMKRYKRKVYGWHANPEFLLCEVIWSFCFRTLEIIKSFIIFNVHGWFALHACRSVHTCTVSIEARSRNQISWDWHYRWWVATLVLGIEPWSSERAANALTTEIPLWFPRVIKLSMLPLFFVTMLKHHDKKWFIEESIYFVLWF